MTLVIGTLTGGGETRVYGVGHRLEAPEDDRLLAVVVEVRDRDGGPRLACWCLLAEE